MYCTSCGKEFHSADDTFCRYCGKQRYVLPETGAVSRAKTQDVSSELKQATKKLARRIKQVDLSNSSLVRKFPKSQHVTEKKFLKELDSTELARSLEKSLKPLGLETRVTGTENDLYIEIVKSRSPKLVSGFEDPVTLRVQADLGSTTVSLGRASWTDKGIAQKFGSIVFLPLSFTRSRGLIQDKTLEVIWGAVDAFVNSSDRVVEEIIMEGHGQAVDPRLFGGRSYEIGVFESRLKSTIDGHTRNIAISGEPGIGKSSLLRKFEQIAMDNKCLTVRREIDPTITNVRELANFVLEALRSEAYRTLSRKTEAWDKTKDFLQRRSISVSGPGVGSLSVSSPSEASTFVLQESFFKESMRLWSQLIRSDVKVVVFLFDEADQLQNIEGGWRFLKSVFTRISEAEGKFMLAVAGSLDFSKNVPSGTSLSEVVGSSPIERYLQPVILKEMTAEEIDDVLSKAIHPRESMISSATAGLIYELSGGNPYLAQNIALVTIGHFPGSSEITPRMVNAAIQDNSGNLLKIFSDRLEGRSEDEKKILLGLSHWKDPVSSRQVGLKLKLSDRSTVSAILRQLVLDGLVREPSEGRFKLFSPLFASFLIGDLKVENVKPKIRRKKKQKLQESF